MPNKINEYPARVMCPLVDVEIESDDCLENQSCADREITADNMPSRYKAKDNWRQICAECPYHEI